MKDRKPSTGQMKWVRNYEMLRPCEAQHSAVPLGLSLRRHLLMGLQPDWVTGDSSADTYGPPDPTVLRARKVHRRLKKQRWTGILSGPCSE